MTTDYKVSVSQMETETQAGIAERLCIILFAVLPILQHYKGIFVNAAVTSLLLLFPIVIYKLIRKRFIAKKQIEFVLPLVLFFFFKVVDHGTTVTELGQACVFSVTVIAVGCGLFDAKYFIRVATIISIIASTFIIAQYISYYVLGHHIQMVPTSLLLDRSSQWILAAKTGRASITGRATSFYRPSAFFLEPSHMFIYMFMPMIMQMYSDKFGKRERNISMLISMGMFLCTSGMGIITTIGLWVMFLGKRYGDNRRFSLQKLIQPKSILVFLLFLLGIVLLYTRVSFFQSSINRILGSGHDYRNAISGRVESGNNLVRSLSGIDFVFGVSDTLSGITYNMSGFNATMYQYGIVGTVISYLFYIRGVFKLKNQYFWVCVIIIALSFFSAHTHSTFFMIYSVFVIAPAYTITHSTDDKYIRRSSE